MIYKIARFVLPCVFGFFLGMLGYTPFTWQFWPLLLMFVIYGAASAEDVKHDFL